MGRISQSWLSILIIGCFICIITIYGSFRLFPIAEMTLKSDCYNPISGWNGKIMNIQIYSNSFRKRPKIFSIHDAEEEVVPSNDVESELKADDYPVILWGSHHKTGTYLARKIFAVICARAHWCCVFHVTRDSVHAIRHSLSQERPAVVGHSQWIWYPEELLPLGMDYRFIHFYRDPMHKLLSGYRYHQEGIEPWTLKSKTYARLCDYPRVNITREKSHRNRTAVSRAQVVEYCRSLHLCEPCCRREHEYYESTHIRRYSYRVRPEREYAYICKHLGALDSNTSLSRALDQLSPLEGLRLEGAIDLYESLRMARILNHTWKDPLTLNIDLDAMSSDFENTIRAILNHIEPIVKARLLKGGVDLDREALVKELLFYDLETSPIYRLSMTNPLIAHVDPARKSRADQLATIRSDPILTQAYAPVYGLIPAPSSLGISNLP